MLSNLDYKASLHKYVVFCVFKCFVGFFLQVVEYTGTEVAASSARGVDAQELAQKMSLLNTGVSRHTF